MENNREYFGVISKKRRLGAYAVIILSNLSISDIGHCEDRAFSGNNDVSKPDYFDSTVILNLGRIGGIDPSIIKTFITRQNFGVKYDDVIGNISIYDKTDTEYEWVGYIPREIRMSMAYNTLEVQFFKRKKVAEPLSEDKSENPDKVIISLSYENNRIINFKTIDEVGNTIQLPNNFTLLKIQRLRNGKIKIFLEEKNNTKYGVRYEGIISGNGNHIVTFVKVAKV